MDKFHNTNFINNMKYNNLFAFFVIILLFTSYSFLEYPLKVSGEVIHKNPNISPDIKVPIINFAVGTQFADTDIIMTDDEIQLMYDVITADILKKKIHNLEELEELHTKKILAEEKYYENLQHNVDSYYKYLKEKNRLSIEKKELEEQLKKLNENLYTRHIKLAETLSQQNEDINTKAELSKNMLDYEKKLISDQHSESKKLIR